jgi:hypothetical protein
VSEDAIADAMGNGDVAFNPAPAEHVLYCYGGCGRRYADFGLDVVLPTHLWNRIAVGHPFDETPYPGVEREGRGGVLCAQCIVDRLARLPGVTVAFVTTDQQLLQATDFQAGRDPLLAAFDEVLDRLRAVGARPEEYPQARPCPVTQAACDKPAGYCGDGCMRLSAGRRP